VAGDAAAEQQLEPARLLLAARGPRHEADSQQRRQEGGLESEFVLDHPAERTDALHLAVDCDQSAA